MGVEGALDAGRDAIASRRAAGGVMPEWIVTGKRSGSVMF